MKADDAEALQLRDAAVTIATTKGKRLVPGGPRVFTDPTLAISYTSGTSDRPCTVSVYRWGFEGVLVLSVCWREDGDAVIVKYLTGSWQDRLRRLGVG